MAAEYFRAGESVIALVAEVVAQHHPDLAEARIGVLMRDVAPRSQGKRVFGRAKSVGPELKVLLPHDFIIWFADDVWDELSEFQRRALVDHELCHCTIDENEKIKMKSHDLNEFLCIIERYGFWWPQADEAEQVFQARLNLGEVTHNGKVEAVILPEGALPDDDVWASTLADAIDGDVQHGDPEALKGKGKRK